MPIIMVAWSFRHSLFLRLFSRVRLARKSQSHISPASSHHHFSHAADLHPHIPRGSPAPSQLCAHDIHWFVPVFLTTASRSCWWWIGHVSKDRKVESRRGCGGASAKFSVTCSLAFVARVCNYRFDKRWRLCFSFL